MRFLALFFGLLAMLVPLGGCVTLGLDQATLALGPNVSFHAAGAREASKGWELLTKGNKSFVDEEDGQRMVYIQAWHNRDKNMLLVRNIYVENYSDAPLLFSIQNPRDYIESGYISNPSPLGHIDPNLFMSSLVHLHGSASQSLVLIDLSNNLVATKGDYFYDKRITKAKHSLGGPKKLDYNERSVSNGRNESAFRYMSDFLDTENLQALFYLIDVDGLSNSLDSRGMPRRPTNVAFIGDKRAAKLVASVTTQKDAQSIFNILYGSLKIHLPAITRVSHPVYGENGVGAGSVNASDKLIGSGTFSDSLVTLDDRIFNELSEINKNVVGVGKKQNPFYGFGAVVMSLVELQSRQKTRQLMDALEQPREWSH